MSMSASATGVIRTRARLLCVSVVLGLIIAPYSARPAAAYVVRESFDTPAGRLTIELLDDDLLHFEWSDDPAASAASASAPASTAGSQPTAGPSPIAVTPMVLKTDYAGPTDVSRPSTMSFETPDLGVTVRTDPLAITVSDRRRTPPLELAVFRPRREADGRATLGIDRGVMQNAYGLGEQFVTPGAADGDWIGRVRAPGNEFGNAMNRFNGGYVGNAQFPILYALGEEAACYALFLDGLRAQTWDLTGREWRAAIDDRALRWYVLGGPDLLDLRCDYMELVGRPPVPPKKMFGLWVCEYGYDDWAELDDKLRTLRAGNFPVDGFVLDLQWFGGIKSHSPDSRMGALTFDTARFPNPAGKIATLASDQGVGIMLIEEPYVAAGRPEFADLTQRGCLAGAAEGGGAAILDQWWGKGGMLDWTHAAGADYWHDLKRRPLIDQGVMAHWTDLGEPENFDPTALYFGLDGSGRAPQRDVHNLLNFRWADSIARGYARHHPRRRPFIMSRSGTSGIQRFGAALWSGDIGSNLSSLAAHLNAQTHMCFSGVDYFGADIGGFRRDTCDGDENEMFTRWFAHGMAFDVPGRTHTSNNRNQYETAPDRIGDKAANLAGVRQRYELIPYLYSLAHRAWQCGEPVIAPMVLMDALDPTLRRMGRQKLIGRDLMIASAPQYGTRWIPVYLPAGEWIDYHDDRRISSRGEWIQAPTVRDGVFRLPAFARAGAILPQMFVDPQTMNAYGRRKDGSTRDELIVRAYPADRPGEFTLFEDDGEGTAYLAGAVRATRLRMESNAQEVRLTIGAAAGEYDGAPRARANVVRVAIAAAETRGDDAAAQPRPVKYVLLNGAPLPRSASRPAFDAAEQGWWTDERSIALAKSPRLDVGLDKVFEFLAEERPPAATQP